MFIMYITIKCPMLVLILLSLLRYHPTYSSRTTGVCPQWCQCQQNSVHCKYSLSNLSNVSDHLTISHRNITVINKSTLQIPSLKSINLHFCHIQEISEEAFSRLKRLEYLDLSVNDIKSIKNQFSELNTLKILNLSRNSISTILINSFEKLINLQILVLKINRLSRLPYGIFNNLQKLEVLDISHNQLYFIQSEHLLPLVIMHSLHLDHNNLKTLDKSSFTNLTKFKTIQLNDNPWECSCGIYWLHESMNDENGRNTEISSNNICASPASLKGKNIKHLSNDNFNCESPVIIALTVNIYAKAKSNVLLSCNSSGYPGPGVVWITPRGEILVHPSQEMWLDVNALDRYPDNLIVEQATPSSKATVLENGSLQIEHFKTHFAGKYTCIAINPSGNASATVTLHLESFVIDVYLVSLWLGSLTSGAFLMFAILMGLIRICCKKCCCKRKPKSLSIYSEPTLLSKSQFLTPGGSSCKFSSTPKISDDESESEYEYDNDIESLQDVSFDSTDGSGIGINLKQTVGDVRLRLQEHIQRSRGEVRKKMQRVRESSSYYMQSIRESSSMAANRVKAGVVLGVEHVKYHVRSIKELCGTGDIGQTISTISITTNVDSSVETKLEKKHTFV